MARTTQLLLTAGWLSGLGLVGVAEMGDRSWAQEAPPPSQEIPVEPPPETPAPETPTPGAPVPETVDESTGSRFTCQLENGQYTVMYTPVSQPGESYPWAVPEDMGSAWPAERRCNEISSRLEEYRPDGLLELQNAVENGYDTVCVTTEAVGGCRIVFTVPPGQDPQITRDNVFNNLVLADQGSSTQGVTTFTGEDSSILGDLNEVLGLPSDNIAPQSPESINLRPFLDPADGGTGAQLSPSSGRPLNPDNF